MAIAITKYQNCDWISLQWLLYFSCDNTVKSQMLFQFSWDMPIITFCWTNFIKWTHQAIPSKIQKMFPVNFDENNLRGGLNLYKTEKLSLKTPHIKKTFYCCSLWLAF